MLKKTSLGLAALLLTTSLVMPAYADSDDDGHDNGTEQSENNSNDHDRDDNLDDDNDDHDKGKNHGRYEGRGNQNMDKYGANRNRFDKTYVTGNRAAIAAPATTAPAINNTVAGNNQ